MKKLTVISSALLTTLLSVSLTGCFSTPEPVPTLTPLPKPTVAVTPTPEAESTPDYSLDDEEMAKMETSLEALSDSMGVDFTTMNDYATGRPVYLQVSNEVDYVTISYVTEDFPKEAFTEWMNSQNLQGDWVDFVPTEIEKIWGFTDGTVGKRSESIGDFTYNTREDGTESTVTIWKE